MMRTEAIIWLNAAVVMRYHLLKQKTMDLLDQLGITYIREKSFDGLVGDSGRGLRFDFVLSKSSDKDGKPIF